MSKPWGGGTKIGAWADEAELADGEQDVQSSFPSLKEASSNNAKSKKQQNKKKMTLSEFTSGAYTAQEIVQLPTAPRQRTESEMEHGRLGGGFSSYGGRRDRDDERRGPTSRVSDFAQVSRADEVHDWSKDKKTIPLRETSRYGSSEGGRGCYGSGEGGRGGYGSGRGGYGGGKADGNDNWGVGKTQEPVRLSTFGSSVGVGEERRRLVLEPRKVGGGSEGGVKGSKGSLFGEARPREEVLAEKGVDWNKVELEIEGKRPTSAQSNRSEGGTVVVKPRVKVNLFGDAKPREVLLEEQGKDWRKMDMELEHRRVDRLETEEEKMLKEEIEELRKKLEKESVAAETKESEQEPGSNNNHHDLSETICEKEKDLEMLTRELDDRVRFRQKPVERPGSGAGRTGSYSERTHSRSGSIDDSRSFESTERPRSRGAVDAWVRPAEEQQRNLHGSKERGFFNNRSSGRQGW